MKKILICGESCSGKTTFGLFLSYKLNIKSYDLDELHWLPGWNVSSDDMFNEKLHNKEISKIKRVETKSNSSFTVKILGR